ncbi:glycosyl transferase family 2 [Peptococcaceae bacterium CEB3]|nr:glycosyl transferase family 2 [Peptococcaceae bacterium CEB3]
MNNVAAGIVLYNPDRNQLRENINAILPQVDLLLLVDNNSHNYEEILPDYTGLNNVYLKRNPQNMGIAAALNQIVEFCRARGYRWVLTLDQDSVCSPDLIETYSKYWDDNKIGIITPRIIDQNYLEDLQATAKRACEYVQRCITSGSLINIQLCRQIGGFDEKMFIDLVDFEYCARLQEAGYQILLANDVVIFHRLGNLKVYNFLGKKIRVSNHSPIRKYYYVKNYLYYRRRHNGNVGWMEVCLGILKTIGKVVIFEADKRGKLRAIFMGIKDGLEAK